MGCSLYMAHVARGHIYTSPPKSASSFCFFIIKKVLVGRAIVGWKGKDLYITSFGPTDVYIDSAEVRAAVSNRVHPT